MLQAFGVLHIIISNARDENDTFELHEDIVLAAVVGARELIRHAIKLDGKLQQHVKVGAPGVRPN